MNTMIAEKGLIKGSHEHGDCQQFDIKCMPEQGSNNQSRQSFIKGPVVLARRRGTVRSACLQPS